MENDSPVKSPQIRLDTTTYHRLNDPAKRLGQPPAFPKLGPLPPVQKRITLSPKRPAAQLMGIKLKQRHASSLSPGKYRPRMSPTNLNAGRAGRAASQHAPVPEPPKRVPLSTITNSAAECNLITIKDSTYCLHERLGSGGYSTVYRVSSLRDNKNYALKRVSLQGLADFEAAGIRLEIQLLLKLRGFDRVVQLYQYKVNEKYLHMVMEKGQGDLSRVIHSMAWDKRTSADLMFYCLELLKCVKQVHDQNIVHSDLKPSNFIIVNGRLKLIDFGISSPIPETTAHVYKEGIIGTSSYMAPEALTETTKYQYKTGKPSDIWAIGCIIYEMIYGCPPFQRYGRRQVEAIKGDEQPAYEPAARNGQRLPFNLVNIIKGMLNKDPAKRLDVVLAIKRISELQRVNMEIMLNLANFAARRGKECLHYPSEEKVDELAKIAFAHIIKFKCE